MARQRELVFRTRGGKRKGAGRKPTGVRARVPHGPRPAFSARHPLLITTRVLPDVGPLRTQNAYEAIRDSLAASINNGFDRPGFRVCHVSIQGTHIDLIAEATDRAALSRGMQGFLVSCARRLNAVVGTSNGLGRPRRGR